MKKNKKLLTALGSLTLCAALCMGVAGCSNTGKKDADNKTEISFNRCMRDISAAVRLIEIAAIFAGASANIFDSFVPLARLVI